MRASIIVSIGILISPKLIGQNTRLITTYFQNSKQIKEEYYALVENENIKHGKYILYFRTSEKDFSNHKHDYISRKGFYFQNQLDSTWIYYIKAPGGHWIEREENYNKGKKSGIWKKYIADGEVIKRFDYDLNKEVEPIFKVYISYPAIASEIGIQGTVKVRVTYNNDCTVSGTTIVQSSSPTLNDGAVNYVSQTEKLRLMYSLIKDCSTRRDSTYTINFTFTGK